MAFTPLTTTRFDGFPNSEKALDRTDRLQQSSKPHAGPTTEVMPGSAIAVPIWLL